MAKIIFGSIFKYICDIAKIFCKWIRIYIIIIYILMQSYSFVVKNINRFLLYKSSYWLHRPNCFIVCYPTHQCALNTLKIFKHLNKIAHNTKNNYREIYRQLKIFAFRWDFAFLLTFFSLPMYILVDLTMIPEGIVIIYAILMLI